MNSRHLFRWLWLVLFTLVVVLPFCAGTGAAQNARKDDATVTTVNGLTVVTFPLGPGDIIVKLPEDMRAGDTISGTVVTEPKGNTAQEKAKNQDVLNGYVIDLGSSKVKPDQPLFRWTPPIPQPNSPVRYELKIIEVLPAPRTQSGAAITPEPKIVARAVITPDPKITYPTTPSGAVITPDPKITPSFIIPPLGQTGRPIVITGPFDGNFDNTKLTIGGQPMTLLAESPRQIVVQSPSNVTGPAEITVKEGNKETKGTFRSVGVDLTAPKTSLMKGERTELHVEVNGLQGLTQPVPLKLESQGVITMVGGNYQPLVIQPSQVGADGRFTTTRGITGVQTGGWTATATVVTYPFDVCLQDDNNTIRVILINTFTGDYLWQGSGGTGPTYGAPPRGTVTTDDCTYKLSDHRPDRRVIATVDMCNHTGSASIQSSPPNMPKIKFTITDRNTADNTCSCGPGCK